MQIACLTMASLVRQFRTAAAAGAIPLPNPLINHAYTCSTCLLMLDRGLMKRCVNCPEEITHIRTVEDPEAWRKHFCSEECADEFERIADGPITW